MSTKMTLADTADIRIDTDLADDSVWVRGLQNYEVQRVTGLSVELTPGALDTIARLHSEKRFPHQQQESRSDMIKAATLGILGGVSAISPELFVQAKARVAAVVGMDPDSQEFNSEFSRALHEIPCDLD
jgi:hypothetical protein